MLSRAQLTRKQPSNLLAKEIYYGDDEHTVGEQNSAFGVSIFMDRSFEQIRTEVLELDHDSQRRLVEAVEDKLSETETEFDEEWKREIKRRLDEHRRGEGSYVTAEESIANARKYIEDAKRARGWT